MADSDDGGLDELNQAFRAAPSNKQAPKGVAPPTDDNDDGGLGDLNKAFAAPPPGPRPPVTGDKSATAGPTTPTPGWGDALKNGLANAVPFSHDIGAAIQAGETYLPKWAATDNIGDTDPNSSFSDRFHQQKARINADDARTSSAFPITSMVTPIIAGGLALPIEGPVAAASNAARYVAPGLGRAGSAALGSAAVGSGLGAAYGAGNGDTTDERLANAKSGALWGGVAGGIAPVVGDALGAAASKLGLTSPSSEASKAIGHAVDPTAKLSSTDVANAQTAGQPVTVADALGGGQLRRLVDQAAVGSPEAQQQIRNVVESRFNEQGARSQAFMQNLFGSNLNADDIMSDLQDKARTANKTNYDAAFNSPNAQSVWNPQLENLLQSPTVRQAVAGATRVSQDEAALHGSPMVKNPFVTDPATGAMTLPQGTTPSLPFWDIVKRNLDDMHDSALGPNGKPTDNSRRIANLRTNLVNTVTAQVPEYAQARAGAAGFFGEQDAFTAGMKYLGKKNALQSSQDDAALNALPPPQKDLFGKGLAASIVNNIGNANNRTNALRQFNTPATAQKLRNALGPNADKVESYLRVEDRMDQLRQSLGNSLTAQRITDQGHGQQVLGHGVMGAIANSLGPVAGSAVAGGVGSYELGNDPLKGAAYGAAAGFALKHSAAHRQAINSAIANMLMEGNPAKVANTSAAIAAKPGLMSALRSLSPSRLTLTAPAARNASQQQQPQLAPAYAKGGAVKRKSHEELVSRLMSASEQAKAATKRDTKSLLSVPDNSIARALAVAQKAI